MNPGDLVWDELQALGDCEIFDRTAEDERLHRCRGAEVILTNKVPVDAALIAGLPDLAYVGVMATGVNVVDLEAANARGIVVTNVPGYSTPGVAQLTFGLILELTHRVGAHSDAVHRGDWVKSEDFCFWKGSLLELSGLTLGLVGFGAISQAVARIGLALGMRVRVNSRTERPLPEGDIAFVDPDTLFSDSDVISLHCPLTPETDGLINEARLRQMKSSAFLINTGRGPLVDEAALAWALRSGEIAGAGLDVLSSEPPVASNPLLGAPNCVITPHLAWATLASRKRLYAEVVGNISAWQSGAPVNVVNQP